jgi:hypothetical protein
MVSTTATLSPESSEAMLPDGSRQRFSDLTHLPPPREPTTWGEAGVKLNEAEALVLKCLFHFGHLTGGEAAREVCLPKVLVSRSLERLRSEFLVAIRSSAGVNDYVYELTEQGFRRARQHMLRSPYVGPAPVPLGSYRLAMEHQSLRRETHSTERLTHALGELDMSPRLVSRLAQGISDGRGLFLHGSSGNGKTSIAERIGTAFGSALWIPRTVGASGDVIRLFDPTLHSEVFLPELDSTPYDRRWVLIRRPTVMVGGELTLQHFDARSSAAQGICEAPLHMKAVGGVLVIDDFGRQRVTTTEILNRLIVPLEKGSDYLHLASGRQLEVPFDALLVLATNLEPRELVDEAFLRRIPYKIEVPGPTRDAFVRVWNRVAAHMGFAAEDGVVEYLLTVHYEQATRPLRFCHPRDLLRQVRNYCIVHRQPLVITREAIDAAAENYFGLF